MADTLTRIEQGEFFLIAGPCAAESAELCLQIAGHVAELAGKHALPFVFKASYKKANRLSKGSYAGPGLDDGLEILNKVKQETGLPVITDIHETREIAAVAEVADILQIPAFLCRQTELVVGAARTGKWVNIKKGQFLAPEDMGRIAAKAESNKVMLTERGVSFGYHALTVDFRSFLIMRETGYPVVYDVTHSLQLPGGAGATSTGQPQYVIPMARAAAAIGIDGLFVETHPEPAQARSDAGAMLPLEKMGELVEEVLRVRKAAQS
ncbi:3-deoxy-8-phosphooctulonate synthase [candidate division GN15 bacterium]|nr:3-deoxy-8-phosphooctulonate synthase [candidate division GN15 bacterium]